MPTFTSNYQLVLPVPNSPIDANIWGTQLNTQMISTLDINLKTTALMNISNTAPTLPTGSPLAGQSWINTNSSSTTNWSVQIYDGAAWCLAGTINPTTHIYTPSSIPSKILLTIVTSGLSPYSYTPTSGMTSVIVECYGGGGGGGGGQFGNCAGSGGGAGGAGRVVLQASSIVSPPITVTVGTGGTYGTGNANGSNGNTSSFGSFISSTGGLGGLGSGAINQALIGGTNGTSSGSGVVSLSNSSGFPSFGVFGYSMSGAGGYTSIGTGGKAVVSQVVAISTGGDGGLGGGGGGGGIGGSAGSASGGLGGAGLVLIYELIG